MSLRSMWRPLGRPNCRHSARNFPSWSKIWMRSFERSATNSRPLESMARAWGTSNSACPLPALPQALMNFPSFENFTMRALVFSPCPSATKMSPLGATKTSDSPLKVSGPSPATPGLPSVIKTFPSELNLPTVRPVDHATTEARHQLAGGVELLDRRDIRALAGLCATAIVNPDAGAISIDVDSDRLSPRTAFGKLCPILHCAIGVGRGIGILGMGPPRGNGHRRGDSDAKHQSRTITHVTSSL